MALPVILKDMMLFNEGEAYIGKTNSVTPPKLGRKMEAYRGPGMDAEVELDMGGDYGPFEFELPSPERQILRQFGIIEIAGVGLRFRGAYQNDETGAYEVHDITVRGRHSEIEAGEQKLAEKGAFKVKTAWTYFKWEIDGAVEIEIDKLNGTLIVGGVDRSAERRAALGI